MTTRDFSRRDFIRTSSAAGAGLVIGFHIPMLQGCTEVAPVPAEGGFQANGWIRVDPAGFVHVVYDEHEMGQGSSTGFMMMACDEMNASWSRMIWEPTPTNPAAWQEMTSRSISTGGSTTIRLGWDPIRTAAAQAREMLRSAAATRWGVDVEECETADNTVTHGPTGQSLGYGELAEEAATLPVPNDPPLKTRDQYWLIGNSTNRLDLKDKVLGKTTFGMDLRLPDMLFATFTRAVPFQGSVTGVDDTAARAVPGVVDVKQLEGGVAVYATDTWAALQGKQALVLEIDDGPFAGQSSETLLARCRELAQRSGEVEKEEGNPDRAMAQAAQVVEGYFDTPFLDHAPMEPLNATAHVRAGEVEVWVPTQGATGVQRACAAEAGVDVESVIVHSLLTGGGFGRRLNPDDALLAVRVAKEVEVPVQLVLTREDTFQHGFYRPATYQVFRAGLGSDGLPAAWTHRIIGPAPSRGTVTGGAANPPYTLPNFRLDYHLDDWGTPIGPWRSVGNTQTGFAVESFIDECAHAAGIDPFEYRRTLMRDANPRLLNCLEMVAERADWGRSMGDRQGQGIAAWTCFGGFAAMVAEVTVDPDGTVRVDRVVSVSDHGTIVNPEAVRSQIEGGIVLSLTATLKSGVHIENGGARESNFHDHPLLAFNEMPAVEVFFVESTERPGGVGEPPIPPPPPAVCNAVFAATGRRVRTLPIDKEFLRST